MDYWLKWHLSSLICYIQCMLSSLKLPAMYFCWFQGVMAASLKLTSMYLCCFQGVMAAAPLAFIIPPLCVMKLRQEPIFSKNNIIPILISSFGTIVAVVGFIMAVVNFSEGNQCSHGRNPAYCLPEDSPLTNSSHSMMYTTTPPIANWSQCVHKYDFRWHTG